MMLRTKNAFLNGRRILPLAHHKRQLKDSGETLKKSVLNEFHLHHDGKMVPFAGWSMPVQYKGFGIIDSHLHTRKFASLFDVSHMLQTKIFGKDKEDFIESLVVGNILELKNNTGTLSVFTNKDGGIMDDVIINQTDKDHLYIVSNAGCSSKITEHFKTSAEKFKSLNKDVNIEFIDNGLVALQGPHAEKVLQEGVNGNLKDIFFMEATDCNIFGINGCRITRCGYTGEDGFEISVPKKSAADLAEKILEHKDVKLAGLGARDSLRLEAGLCLYGNDIDENTTPVQASLLWCIGKRRRKEGNFPGADVILREIKNKPSRKRVGIIVENVTARAGAEILGPDGKVTGKITSGCPSPTTKQNIAMGYVDNLNSKIGTNLSVIVRKKQFSCRIVKMPFVTSNYYTK